MNFNDFLYVPIIRTRASELLGVKHLREDTKAKILPFVNLSKLGRISASEDVLNKWIESYSQPAIIGLADIKKLQLDDLGNLISGKSNFDNWHSFVKSAKSKNGSLIPSLILNKSVGKRDFVKQLQRFETDFEKISLKINPINRREVAAAITAASIIDKPQNILFILDCGQITRERQKVALDATIHALNEIRSIEPSFEIVIASTSFPRTFLPYCKNREESYGEIPMLEWENYHAIGGNEISIYGDYASIHGEFYEGSYAKFVARVDYPTPSNWIFERRKERDNLSRETLYAEAAASIKNCESWDDELTAWGADMINSASNAKLEKFGTPAKWISVRLNCHIERIVSFLETGVTMSTPDLDDDIDWDDDDWF